MVSRGAFSAILGRPAALWLARELISIRHMPAIGLVSPSQRDTTRTTVLSESQALGIEQNIKSTWHAHGTVLA
jgi:hypothetical protein